MRFPKNEIISLLDERLEYNIAESTNKDLILKEVWDDEFAKGLQALKLEYGPSQGDERLRAVIGKKLGVHKDQILVTNGAAFGIFLTVLCLCEQGDEVITVQPNFPPTMDVIEGLGFKKTLIQLSFDKQYQLEEHELFNKISGSTKLIILVSPLNPTGTTLTKKEVIRISNRLSKEYPNCKLLIDETYREATYGDNDAIPTFAGLMDNIITVTSLSKCHGTPGLRIGWLQSSDQAFLKNAGIAKMNTVISNSVLDEHVALHVLLKESQIFEKRRLHAAAGLEATRNWVEQNKDFVRWIEPRAGALCCIKLKEAIYTEGDIKLFYHAAKEMGIQIANGQWFGASNRYFRLGFGYMALDKLNITLGRLSELLSKIAGKNK